MIDSIVEEGVERGVGEEREKLVLKIEIKGERKMI